MKVNVKINGYKNPVGYLLEDIRVSWKVSEAQGTQTQTVTIDVCDENNVLCHKEGQLNSLGERLDLTLTPRTHYDVTVKVIDDQGEEGIGKAFFETSKLDEPWQGVWIGSLENDKHPLFQKIFEVKDQLAQARLYISGLGMYTCFLNDQAIGKEILTPYYSDYHQELQYQTYDVTDYLKKENTLQVVLGNGWYKGKFGLAHQENNFGNDYKLIAELHLRYADGHEEVIVSDESWSYKGSDIASSSIYDGEVINHCLYENQDNPWQKAQKRDYEGKLIARYSLPVIAKEDIPVKQVITTPRGDQVLDFGQNFAGYVTFNMYLPKGTKVVLDFGEIMQDGEFYNANYREAKSQFVYISDGRQEIVKPHFTYFGFRYVRVSGIQGKITRDEFMGKAIYSDMALTGNITTGHDKVNRLFLNALWGQKSNFVDFPTDCPQRDERLGWSGDAQVFSGTATYNMDTAAFYHKFLHDLRTAQNQYDGIVPGVIPVLDPKGPIFSSVWGDIATILPAVLYEHYGDLSALKEYYPMMKDWVDKITREDIKRGQQYLYNFGNQLGDWLALDGRTEQSMNGGTDEYYIGSMYYAMSVKTLYKAASALSYEEDEKTYKDLYHHIYEAILREYYTPTGRLAIDSQTGYIVALYSGIYPSKKKVIEGLKTRLYKDCYKLKGGFVGAPLMCRVLAENGLVEEAFYFLLQEDYPGWLHCVNLGATTIWERWNSVLDDGHLSGTMMNSLNHYAYGAIVEFLYRDVAGFKPLTPGCRQIEISPLVNQKLGHVSMTYDSPAGLWKVAWEIQESGKIHVTITVPFDAKAMVGLPFYPGDPIGKVGPGTHVFEYMPTEDLRSRYTKKTLFNEMLKDPEAMKIIERISPLLQWFLSTGNEDFYYESLDTLMGMSYMGFKQEEVLALGRELSKLHD